MNASNCERLLVLYDSCSINLLKRLCFHSLPQCLLSPLMCVFGLLVKTIPPRVYLTCRVAHIQAKSCVSNSSVFISAPDVIWLCEQVCYGGLLNERICVQERKHALKYTIVPLVQMPRPGIHPLEMNVPSPLWNQHLLLGHICVRCITFYMQHLMESYM